MKDFHVVKDIVNCKLDDIYDPLKESYDIVMPILKHEFFV